MKTSIYKATLEKPNFILCFFYETLNEINYHYLEYNGKYNGYTNAVVGQWKIKYKQQ